MSFNVVTLVNPNNTIVIKLMRYVTMLLCYFFLNYPISEFIVVIIHNTVLHYYFECSYCFIIMINFPNHYLIFDNPILRILMVNLFLLNIIVVLYHFNCLRYYIVVLFD